MSQILAAAAALLVGIGPLLVRELLGSDAIAAQALRIEQALLAAGFALSLAALALRILGERSPPSQRARTASASLLGAGLLAGLASAALARDRSVSGAQAGLTGLSLLALVVLAAWLCFHLRASLLRARFWAMLLLLWVVAVAQLRYSANLAAATGNLAAATGNFVAATGRVAGTLFPGTLPWFVSAALVPLAVWGIARLSVKPVAELAGLFALGQATTPGMLARGGAEPVALVAAVALLQLGGALRTSPGALRTSSGALRTSAGALRISAGTLETAALVVAAGFLGFDLFSALPGRGYDWLVVGLLCAATAAASHEETTR